ncbi:hypothetical protein ACRCPM_26470, partial [Pseudomonas aeruginosa]
SIAGEVIATYTAAFGLERNQGPLRIRGRGATPGSAG